MMHIRNRFEAEPLRTTLQELFSSTFRYALLPINLLSGLSGLCVVTTALYWTSLHFEKTLEPEAN